MILRLVRSVSFDINDSAKSRVDTYNIKKGFQEERLWRIKLCWMQAMGYRPGVYTKERKEKDDNLQLTLAVGKILEDNGIDVVYM